MSKLNKDFDALGEPSVKTKMSLDDALEEFGYGKDDWPSIQEINKRFFIPRL